MASKTSRAILICAFATFLIGLASNENSQIDFEWLREAYGGPVDSWPAPTLDEGAEFVEFGPLERRPVATDEQEIARVRLGAKLFRDPKLSASGQIACESCHNRRLGWGDALPVSFGHDRQQGTRNAQSLFTAQYMDEMFWDGRAGSLEEQAHLPIINPVEMAAEAKVIEERVNADAEYREAFASIYGVEQIAMADIAGAIADFERSIRLPVTRWDKALEEGTQVLNDQQLWGLHLFRTKAGCANCHHGPLLSDQEYHNLGFSFYGRRREDVGRFEQTGDPKDVGAFRTPSLRAVRRTGPYMHNGLFPSLRGLMNIYAAGGGRDRTEQSATTDAPPPTKSPLLKKRDLSREERDALVAFLETL